MLCYDFDLCTSYIPKIQHCLSFTLFFGMVTDFSNRCFFLTCIPFLSFSARVYSLKDHHIVLIPSYYRQYILEH